jgi:hypothetical protein
MSLVDGVPNSDVLYRNFVMSRMIGMRTNRYSWWTHWRELADYFLPRRYKWLITPNQMARGSPINQHILDSTGVLAARNLASGLMSGKTSPQRPWFQLKIGRIDSTTTSPVSLWLAECERLMRLVFHESNFYQAMAIFYYDLVIYGTSVMLIYEDFENVINCFNPCAGEYYIDIDGQYRPTIMYREFTMTISAVVGRFGLENCSTSVQEAYKQGGAALTREIIVAHAIEPNDRRDFGIPASFKFRECYWEWGGSTSPQSGQQMPPAFLEKKGYYEQPNVTVRWDLVSNDPYGRSVAMDALGDQKQLQLESRRKAQAIDKMVNPPLIADVQLKNQPASLLPGGITYAHRTQDGKPAMAPIYDSHRFPVDAISQDLAEVRERLKYTFYNHLFQPISQFETRSNVTAEEINQRKAEALIMLGPVFERLDNEGLKVVIERVWAVMSRAGIFPPPPQEIAGMEMNIDFHSMLAAAQDAIRATSIERTFGLAGNLVGVDPGIMDNIDVDWGIQEYSYLSGNEPRLMRTPDEVAQIRQDRARQQQQAQQAQIAEQLSKGAKNLAGADMGGGTNALQAMTGGLPS